jgi:hypothetical protein
MSKKIEEYRLEDDAVAPQVLMDLLEDRATYFTDEEIEPTDFALDRTRAPSHQVPIVLIRKSELVRAESVPQEEASDIQTHFGVEPHAVGLLCSRLKVPHQFFTRCIAQEGPDGLRLDAHMQFWLDGQNPETKWFVRMDDYSGERMIRGVLTGRYEVYDNRDAFELVLRHLPDLPDWGVSFLWTPTMIYVDLRNQKMTRTICGKEIHAAIRMKNSEVGCSAMSCEMLTVNATDSSGIFMTGYSGFRRIHLQKKEDDFAEKFKADLEAMVDQMDESLNDLEATQHIKVLDPEEIKERIFDTNRFDKGQQESIEKLWVEGSVKTLFDIIQIMAMAGADTEISMERREAIQKAAGKMIYNMGKFGRWLDRP